MTYQKVLRDERKGERMFALSEKERVDSDPNEIDLLQQFESENLSIFEEKIALFC